ncbi:hypothetical protein [Flavobacterium sp. LAR06]|uniref:hypothetical protein n=1 Tax=Flavobacterium sp. LAR06 TaxID=3064897 RepID=UPI0035C09DCC
MADSYYFNNDFKNAKKYYKKLLAKYPNDIGAEYYYKYFLVLKSENQIKAANFYLKKYNELSSLKN